MSSKEMLGGRKRARREQEPAGSSKDRGTRRRALQALSKEDEAADVLIARLRENVRVAGGDLNPLAELLQLLAQDGSTLTTSAQVKAIQAAREAFAQLVARGWIVGSGSSGDQSQAVAAVREWSKSQWKLYLELLLSRLSSETPDIAAAALQSLMECIRATSNHLASLNAETKYAFDRQLWLRFVPALLESTDGTRALFAQHYLNKYDDVRYHLLNALPRTLTNRSSSEFAAKTSLQMLEALTTMPSAPEEINAFFFNRPPLRSGSSTKRKPSKKRKNASSQVSVNVEDTSTGIFDDDDSEEEADFDLARTNAESSAAAKTGQHPLLSLNKHREAFTQAWVAVLGFPFEEEHVKSILVALHSQVLPHLTSPRILMDFLTDACDSGGTTAILALNGLFTLITKHGLDYPDFYTKLYRLLDANLLHVRYRSRFLRLLDTFLASTSLPANLIASFVKRLARLSLFAPPAAIVSIVPFIYNLLKRHTACMVLIHSATHPEPGSMYDDPFKAEETDPLRTDAIDSSLWELATLRKHYMANIATLAKIFQEVFTKQSYDMEDFLDHTYSTLFETESSRKVKNAPALNSLPGKAEVPYVFLPTRTDATSSTRTEEDELRLEGKLDAVSKYWAF